LIERLLSINSIVTRDGVHLLQILNLTQALHDGKSPLQLVQMPVVTVERRKAAYGRLRVRNDSTEDTLTQKFSTRSPFFSWCWL